MRIGAISDIHANAVALEAVLEDMPTVDLTVCAGDVVGYNPWPGECVETVREREIPTILGNHDRMVVSDRNFRGNQMARAGVRHAKETLTEEQLAWLEALPVEARLADGRISLVHGHPQDPDHYTYPAEFRPGLLGDEELLLMGHTHVQHHEIYSDGMIVNPGSVGQPRDSDPRAAYAVIDLDARTVDERRVEYDIDTVQEAVRAAGLPERTGRRLAKGQ
ncbi:MAG: metallophosphoesterase family protein [Halobacteriales archaeon]|nr:metallophosphoesterase family protein [Halobacteriales archaeon]